MDERDGRNPESGAGTVPHYVQPDGETPVYRNPFEECIAPCCMRFGESDMHALKL